MRTGEEGTQSTLEMDGMSSEISRVDVGQMGDCDDLALE